MLLIPFLLLFCKACAFYKEAIGEAFIAPQRLLRAACSVPLRFTDGSRAPRGPLVGAQGGDGSEPSCGGQRPYRRGGFLLLLCRVGHPQLTAAAGTGLWRFCPSSLCPPDRLGASQDSCEASADCRGAHDPASPPRCWAVHPSPSNSPAEAPTPQGPALKSREMEGSHGLRRSRVGAAAGHPWSLARKC